MSRRILKIGLLVVGAVLVAAVALFWLNLSQLSRKLAEDRVPGLHFENLEVGWNRVALEKFRYAYRGSVAADVSAPSVYARPAFLSFVEPEIKISKLDIPSPTFRLVRTPVPGGIGSPPGAPPGKTASAPRAKPGRVADFNEITILNGEGELVDQTVEGPPARLALEGIYLRIKNLKYPPQAGAVYLRSSARIKDRPDSRLDVSGWIDPVNQSSDLKINLTNLDLEHLRPYFRGRVSALEKAAGRVSVRLDLMMVAGVFDANGEVTLSDLRVPGGEGERPGIGRVLLTEYLKLRGNRIAAPFKVKGNLRTNEHRVDFSALLSSLLNREVDAAAFQKGLQSGPNLKALEKELRDKLRERTKGLFR